MNCNQKEIFNAFAEQCLFEEDKSFSRKEDLRLVSRTSKQHLSVVRKTIIILQEKLSPKVSCIVRHFHLGGEKSLLLKKKSVNNSNFCRQGGGG